MEDNVFELDADLLFQKIYSEILYFKEKFTNQILTQNESLYTDAIQQYLSKEIDVVLFNIKYELRDFKQTLSSSAEMMKSSLENR